MKSMKLGVRSTAMLALSAGALALSGPVAIAEPGDCNGCDRERDWDKIDPPIKEDVLFDILTGGAARSAAKGAAAGVKHVGKKIAKEAAREYRDRDVKDSKPGRPIGGSRAQGGPAFDRDMDRASRTS